MKLIPIIFIILFFVLAAMSCQPAKTADAVNEEPVQDATADTAIPDITPQAADYPDPKAYSEDEFVAAETDPQTGAEWKNLIGVIRTNKGPIKIKFFHDDAPRHVENFVYLARTGFFNGIVFHRYEPGFVIQGGDPQGTGAGGPGYKIPQEINDRSHKRGAVAAARQGDEMNPERKSSGSQFYIVVDDSLYLDGNYTLWGWVIEGMDIALSLRKGDIMQFIEIREKK